MGIVPNYVVLVTGNEDGDLHHMQGRPRDWFKEASELTLNIHQIFN